MIGQYNKTPITLKRTVSCSCAFMRENLSLSLMTGIVGFFVLAVISGRLFFLTLLDGFRTSPLIALLMILMLAGLVQQVFAELRAFCRCSKPAIPWDRLDVLNFISVPIGALTTFVISNDLGLGAVVASSLVGILGAIVLPKQAAAIFCGSFAGMIAQQLTNGYMSVIIAGSIAGLVFVLSKTVFNGLGGKLGTTAFSGCVIMAVLSGREFLLSASPDAHVSRLIVLYAVIGAVLTYVLSIRFKQGPVMASAIIGLTGGLLLPALHPSSGVMLAVVVFCASFAGMSSRERFPNEIGMLAAGFLAGLVFILSVPHLGGSGGKLGTIAFLSTIGTAGIFNILQWIVSKVQPSTNQNAET